MSRAFIKEPEGGPDLDDLPDRPISPNPNFVTREGLALIDAELARLQGEQEAAAPDDFSSRARLARDLRYWRARRGSAQLTPRPADTGRVQFGSTVTLHRPDGRVQTFRIVGEDEADPAEGKLSYVAPLARALIGKGVGDVINTGGGEADIAAIANG